MGNWQRTNEFAASSLVIDSSSNARPENVLRIVMHSKGNAFESDCFDLIGVRGFKSPQAVRRSIPRSDRAARILPAQPELATAAALYRTIRCASAIRSFRFRYA
jgi:hypothetical protein